MNAIEAAHMLGMSEKTLVTNFKRTQAALLEKNILLEKEGRGSNVNFYVKELIPGALNNRINKRNNSNFSNSSLMNSPRTWTLAEIAEAFDIEPSEALELLELLD